ncbi:response regulator transcription factor [Flavonifractor sp. An306]|uniref:response regulator transcription factor n=1 Tax=Flavonifractor sp. An306 TaxID=1965629 RepID=UPI0031BABCC8
MEGEGDQLGFSAGTGGISCGGEAVDGGEHALHVGTVQYDGQDALDYGLAENYDCLVLDIMMPRRDGLEVLRQLREKGVATPVLLLTAKGEVTDRIKGLNAGADDYLSKPFAMGEFVARVRALTRRSGAFTPDQLTVGDLTLDRTTFELSANGSSVRLGNREYQLLELLMRQQGRFLSTEELMERIWGYESEAELSVVWAYISYLRRKLEGLNAHVRIAASRGRGYMLEAGT